jgi:uncharacterized damage-inducible protein DinB
MAIEMAKNLEHMAWANQNFFSELCNLDDSALASFIVNPDWSVREIAKHIIFSNSRLLSRLSGRPALEMAVPATMTELAVLVAQLVDFDGELLKESKFSEAEIVVIRHGIEIKCMRSTILSQAIHHCTEHRAQLVDALDSKGFTSIRLDDFDLWSFERQEHAN